MKTNNYIKSILISLLISTIFCVTCVAEEEESAWAKEYMRVINSLTNQYGKGSIQTNATIGDEEFMAGVAIVRLIDFDGDGNMELYCAYSNNGRWVNQHVIYGYDNGLVVLMAESRVSNPGTDVSPSTTFLSKGGKVYLVDINEISNGNYYTLQDGKLVSVLSYDGLMFTDTPTLNGAAASSDEIALAKIDMEKGGSIEKISYYYDIDQSGILKTEEVIRELSISCVQSDPTYENKGRISEEGLQEDYIYTFSDGTINPNIDIPILMVNGTFYAKTPLIINDKIVLAPLRAVAEALGAEVSWIAAEKKVIIDYEKSTIELTRELYGSYKICINGEDKGNATPQMVNNSIYMPIQFFADVFGLDHGYLPGERVNTGNSLAVNPIIWLDHVATSDVIEKDQSEGLEWVKDVLRKGLKRFEENNENTRFADEVKRVVPQIAEDIEKTIYAGQAGRYAMYFGTERTILVDYDTNSFYYHRKEHAYGYITKIYMSDQQLFYMGYILG